MAVLEIVKFGHPVLSAQALPIENINGDLQKLVSNMIETMYAAPGVGLAAPQVGIGKRLAVIDVTAGEDPSTLIVIINPEIKESKKIIIRKDYLFKYKIKNNFFDES